MPYEPSITLAEDEGFPKIAKFSENQEKSWHTLGTPPKPASSAVCIIKVIAQCGLHVITDRKGRLCFQKRLSVILSTGEGGSAHMGFCIWRVCLKGVCLQGACLPEVGWFASRGGLHLGCLHPWVLPNSPVLTSSGGHCSGRQHPTGMLSCS